MTTAKRNLEFTFFDWDHEEDAPISKNYYLYKIPNLRFLIDTLKNYNCLVFKRAYDSWYSIKSASQNMYEVRELGNSDVLFTFNRAQLLHFIRQKLINAGYLKGKLYL